MIGDRNADVAAASAEEVDVRGFVLCTKAAIPELLKRGGGAT